ncbi:MAG: transglycosylase domain-containing protein [Anaerolineales bacterium]|nr:transglycosylase domain-containing protein [Anaerolineales bacterium]MCZ2122798.1 transglycosylase domain-containing protein [Anaerolineales bacterium]
MQEFIPILRARRARRLARQNKTAAKKRNFILSGGMLISILLAASILYLAQAYAKITRNLPAVEILPHLLNPPDGLLLQPTRIYDRTGLHLLYTFATEEAPRRYIPINPQNPQHIPPEFVNALIAAQDPHFWKHSGYALSGIDNPESHPTLAQRLVSDLILYNEPPSFTRAIRERILAAQITAQFGREKIIEWYLNSANFGNYAFGVEAAAQLYFGKPAAQLTLAESAILAAVSQTPALNPFSAPSVALQHGREVLHLMNAQKLLSNEALDLALAETPQILPAPLSPPVPAEAFINIALAQIDSQIPRERIERGGLTVITTLDYDLQTQASCATQIYASRVSAAPEPSLENCEAARFLPSLPPGVTYADSSASAVIIDPSVGQVLALVGETLQGKETALVGAHRIGSSADAFVYLTAFTRGLSPASLIWDIPAENSVQNFDGVYHGPMRLRSALANDYQAPLETIKNQVGFENVVNIANSFGVKLTSDSAEPQASLLNLAGAYGVFATQGVYFGQQVDEQFTPAAVLKVEAVDHTVLLNWETPQSKSVATPQLAYLMTNVLSDATVRKQLNALEIGRPAGVKIGQTADGSNAWVIGYTPHFSAAVWTDARGEGANLTPRFPAVLWNALMQYASRNLPRDGWSIPQGITSLTVCDPSGLLPSKQCPNLVTEYFLNGNEPIQADDLYRQFAINRETGLLATVFTPPELVETHTFILAPENARDWARSAGLAIPPEAYDAIQAPPTNPDANLTAPKLFAEVNGVVKIIGTASGEDFDYYRVQVGQGLNPQEWIQLGADARTPVESGTLASWDTQGLSGLYAIQLQVVRNDQRIDTAVIQVTIGE